MTAAADDAGAEIGETSLGHAARRAKAPAWATRVGLLVLALIVTVVIIRLIGQVDWVAVWDALRHLTWWQPLVLIAVVVVRQVLNAIPLAFYIPGVSVLRATVNDLGAILMSAVAPPPSDLALRVGMFNSWGVPTVKGLAGTLMNTLTFYIVRFAAPLLGFVLLIATETPAGIRLLDIVCIAIAAVILVGVLLLVRSDQLASTGSGPDGSHIDSGVRSILRRGVRPASTSAPRSPPASGTGSPARCWGCAGCLPRTLPSWCSACASWASPPTRSAWW